MKNIKTINIVESAQTGVLITNSEFNHTGKIEFVSYGDIFLYEQERVILPPGKYDFDFESTITISVPEKTAIYIISYAKEQTYLDYEPVPDIPDVMEDSQRAMVAMIEDIIRARGYKLEEEDIEEYVNVDEVQLQSTSIVQDDITEEPIESLSTEPETLETTQSDTVQTETNGDVSATTGETETTQG